MTRPAGFFDGVVQRDITIRGTPARSPLFYRDLGMMFAVVTVDLAAARALLPSPALHPLVLPTGRALLGIGCFTYRDSDIGPYNEVALGLAVGRPGQRRPGAWAAVGAILRQTYHSYVCDLPVDTEIAVAGGLDVFNYPKHLTEIRFDDGARTRTCRVLDRASGELLYAVEVDRTPTRARRAGSESDGRPDVVRFVSYPVIGGRVHRALLAVDQQEKGRRVLGGGACLTLGNHPGSALLTALKPGRTLLSTIVPRAQAILAEPEPLE